MAGARQSWAIRICTWEKGYELFSSCADLEGCTKFGWLRDYGLQVKDNLIQSRGLSREEYVRKMRSAVKESEERFRSNID